MNIEEFYEQDERRRESQEIELGDEWHDAAGSRFELSFVVDTREAYLMAAPDTEVDEDPFGDFVVAPEPLEALSVEVIAVLPSTDALHAALDGWEVAMSKPSSVEWLRARLAGSGAA